MEDFGIGKKILKEDGVGKSDNSLEISRNRENIKKRTLSLESVKEEA